MQGCDTLAQDTDAVAQQKSFQSAALMVAQRLRALGWRNAAEEVLRNYAMKDCLLRFASFAVPPFGLFTEGLFQTSDCL